MNILIVDDSRIIRNVLKNVLEELKVDSENIFDAPDGNADLEIVEQNQIDLLLVDWNMPNLNGLDLVKILRGRDSYKKTPIIMITSEAARYNIMEAIKAGVTDYVVKPVSGVVLKKKLSPFMK